MANLNEEDQVFESAAELFGLLSTPVRLKIISAVCNGEHNVSDLLAQIDTTQSDMCEHWPLCTVQACWVAGAKVRRSITAFRASASLCCAEPCARRLRWNWTGTTPCRQLTGCFARPTAEETLVLRDHRLQFVFHPHLEKMVAPAGDCRNSTNFWACGLSMPRLVIAIPASR